MLHITLTSDFGSQNFATASVKGKIYSTFPEALVTDIADQITPFNLQQAVYIFKQAYRFFPPGSFHYIFNDLYTDDKRQLLYAYENQQHIFCADNGFMTMLFADQPAQIFRLQDRMPEYNFLTVTDLFLTQTAAILHRHPSGLEVAEVSELVVRHLASPAMEPDSLEAQVLHIDHYGNVILNVQRNLFEEARRGRKFRILFMRNEEIHTLSKHYNDVPEGNKLCHFNTAGYLEISVNKGHAANLFGFQITQERHLFYNNIKIFFE